MCDTFCNVSMAVSLVSNLLVGQHLARPETAFHGITGKLNPV